MVSFLLVHYCFGLIWLLASCSHQHADHEHASNTTRAAAAAAAAPHLDDDWRTRYHFAALRGIPARVGLVPRLPERFRLPLLRRYLPQAAVAVAADAPQCRGGEGERRRIENGDHAGDDNQEKFPCWLPLMSFSRSELDRATPYERYEQFVQLLDVLLHQQRESEPQGPTTNLPPPPPITLDDDTLVEMIRTNEPLRRLASLAMRPAAPDNSNNSAAVAAGAVAVAVHSTPIGQQLIRLWPRLLVLPPLRAPPPTASSSSITSQQQQQLLPVHRVSHTAVLPRKRPRHFGKVATRLAELRQPTVHPGGGGPGGPWGQSDLSRGDVCDCDCDCDCFGMWRQSNNNTTIVVAAEAA